MALLPALTTMNNGDSLYLLTTKTSQRDLATRNYFALKVVLKDREVR